MSEAGWQELTVDDAAAGTRLDLFVGDKLGLSRTRLKALFDEGAVRVDGRHAKKGQSIAAGQRVSVRWQPQSSAAVADASMALEVLYEDPDLVFLNKPAGVASQPLKPGETGTLANALVARFSECAEASEDPREGGLCHRLDIETSGVVLAARSRETWREVRELFSRHEIDKRYLALVTGPIADDGEIELALRHAARGDHVEPAEDDQADARPARSRFRVLERDGEYSLVEVQIETGVLHQVRAHLAAIGAPIVGDALYGGRPDARLHRFFLHAARLGLVHPRTRQRLEVEAPLPADLSAVRGHLAPP